MQVLTSPARALAALLVAGALACGCALQPQILPITPQLDLAGHLAKLGRQGVESRLGQRQEVGDGGRGALGPARFLLVHVPHIAATGRLFARASNPAYGGAMIRRGQRA